MPLPADNNLLSVSKASSLLEVSADTLRRLDKKGQVTPKRGPNGERLYSTDDLSLLRQILKKPVGERSYGIQETANILRVSPQTIRRWEREGKIATSRTPGGTRFFTLKDIQILQNLPRTVQVQAPTPQMPAPTPQIPALPFSMPEPPTPTQEIPVQGAQTFVVKKHKNYAPYIIITLLVLLLGSTVAFIGRQTFFKSTASNGIEINPNTSDSTTTPYANNPIQQITNTMSNVFKLGSIIFQGAGGQLAEDNKNLFWDATNAFLGIGTNLPNAYLTVSGGVTGTSLVELIGQDSNNILSATNNGTTVFNIDHSGNTQIAGALSDVNDSSLNVLENLAVGGDVSVAGGDITSSNALRTYSTTSSTFGSTSSPTSINGSSIGISAAGAGGDITLLANDDIYFDDGSLTNSIKLANTATALPNGNTGIVDAIVDAYNHGGSSSLFSAVGSGTNTAAVMIVGSGASLSTTGTGTISATDLTCVGCVANSELANSAITVNTSGILSGGATVSLGGTLNLSATEADTLNSVTGRGATTSNAVSVGDFTSTGTTTFGGVAYTWPGADAPVSGYVLSSDAGGSLDWVAQTGGVGGGQWTLNAANGIIYPNSQTVDVLIGASSTASAKFAFTGVNTDGTPNININNVSVLNATTLGTGVTISSLTSVGALASGSITNGFGTITTANTITGTTVNGTTGVNTGAVGGTQRIDATGNLVNIVDILASGYATMSASLAVGNTTALTGPGNINASGRITGVEVYQGANQVCDAGGSVPGCIGVNYWGQALGVLYPVNNTVDVLFGSDATASAKFAFTGINTGGTPTASIAGTIANVAIFIDGNGNIATTNGQNLVLGNSTAYPTGTGNILLNPNGTGYVGIGTTSPSQKLDVSGNININTNGTNALFSTYKGADSVGDNIWIGGGGQSSLGEVGATYEGSYNFSLGTGSLLSNTLGYNNAAVGAYALYHNTTGYTNTSVGSNSLYTNIVGAGLVAVGTNSLYFATGYYNTAVGVSSGQSLTSGSYNTFIGYYAGLNASQKIDAANSMALGNGAYTTADNQVVIGNTSITQTLLNGNVGIGTTAPTALLDVAGAASISGALTFRAGAGSIQTTAFNPLTIGGDTTGNITLAPSNNISEGSVTPGVDNMTDLGTAALRWRNVFGTTITGTTVYQGANQVCDISGNCTAATDIWSIADGALFPKNNTVDVLFGSSATASAKFAFTGVNMGGTPTASIAGTIANVATFIDGNGNISTTNGQDLVLGNSSTYSFTGNILLNPLGLGNVGIGTTSPLAKLSVIGTSANATGMATLIVDQYENQDILTASASGATKFIVDRSGNVTAEIFKDLSDPTYYLDAANVGTSLNIDGNIVSNGAFSITSNATNEDITINAGSGDILLNPSTTGNVGIGTTNPISMLSVGASSQFQVNSTGAIVAATGITSSGTINFSGLSASSAVYTDGSKNLTNTTPTSGQLGYWTRSGTNLYNTNQGDNVGIGTTSPDAGLMIGSVTATGQIGLHLTNAAGTFLQFTDAGSKDYAIGIPDGSQSLAFFKDRNISSAGTEVMRLDSTGNVGIGTTAPASKLSVGGNGDTSWNIYSTKAGGIALYGFNTGATSGEGLQGDAMGTSGWGIYCGAINNVNGCGGNRAWNGASDARLKENVVTISNALDKVMHLRGVNFNWIQGGGADMGFIAQEVLPYVPELIGLDTKTGMYGMRTSQLTGLLVEAVKDQQGQIASLSGQLANTTLTDTGDLKIVASSQQPVASGLIDTNQTPATSYILQATDRTIDRIGAFASVVAANIRAGAVVTEELTTKTFYAFQGTVDNLLISSGLVAMNIQTKIISPLADGTDVTVRVGTATESGKFAIQNSQGTEVAAIDNTGNATFSGIVDSSLLIADSATVSGTLYAGEIKSKSLDEIQALLTQVTVDQNLLTQSASWNMNTASQAGTISNEQLAISNLYVTNQAAVNSLSVTNTVTVGSDLVFQSTINSIDTLSAPLKIQSLARAPVEIMAGLVTIDTQGNVNIAGDLFVAGRIKSSGLTLQGSPFKGGEATESASLLSLQNNQGAVVASVDASGSAMFTNIQTQRITGSDEDRGSVEILPAEDSKVVQRDWNSTPSAVLVSSSYKTQAWVTDISEKGFIIKVSDSPADSIGKLFWWALW